MSTHSIDLKESGAIFQSAVSGTWHSNSRAAGSIANVLIDGVLLPDDVEYCPGCDYLFSTPSALRVHWALGCTGEAMNVPRRAA